MSGTRGSGRGSGTPNGGGGKPKLSKGAPGRWRQATGFSVALQSIHCGRGLSR